jgi:uncharacterized Zn-binding protein involved in type VI secretion
MPLVIRLNDTSDHGGNVATSAQMTLAEGIFIARVGDILDCPIHGPNPIAEGSPDSLAEGAKIARHGDHAQCGAALIASAQITVID